MRQMFDVQLKMNSWISQKWNPANFPKAFIDEYMAIFNLVASTIYDFAAENKQENIDTNVITLSRIMDDFVSDYALVMAKFGVKRDDEFVESLKEELRKIRTFRLDFKKREDKVLTKEEQITRMTFHALYFVCSIKYEIDCIMENNNKKQYEDLLQHVETNQEKLIKQATELDVYDDIKYILDDGKKAMEIDTSKLKYIEDLPTNEFKAANVY